MRVPPCADVAVSIPSADHVGRFERSEQLRTDLRYLSHVVCAIRGNVVQTHLRILLDHPTWRESDVGAHVGDFVVQRTCPDVRISLPLNVWPAQASLVDDSTFLCGRTDTIAAVMAAGLPPAPARCCAASVSQLADVHLPAAAARQLQAAGSALAELRRPLLSSRQRLVACADVLLRCFGPSGSPRLDAPLSRGCHALKSWITGRPSQRAPPPCLCDVRAQCSDAVFTPLWRRS